MRQKNWLLNNIIDTGQCAKCGICTILCPEHILTFKNNTPELTGACLRNGRGTCYEVCPRVSSGKYQIQIREKPEKKQYTTKYTQEKTVNKIIKTLIQKKEIDGAIIIGEDHMKSLTVITQQADKHKNHYKKTPLKTPGDMKKLDLKSVAIAALPCQIQGLRKIQHFPYLAKHEPEKNKQGKQVKIPEIKYLIGHFCTDKYDYTNMTEILQKEKIDIKKVKQFKREIPELKIITEEETYTLPLKPVKINEGCKLCRDYESEMADISVGTEKPDKTCVIIRNKKLDYLRKILDLEEDTHDLPKTRREHKLNRFMVNVLKREKEEKPLSYYWISDYPGIGKQADENYFIRLKSGHAGWYSHKELHNILEISEKYNLSIKITTRAAYELHDAKASEIPLIIDEIKKKGLKTGSEGPLVRTTLACPGEKNCKTGLIDTIKIADTIDEKFAEYPTPYKFKIAVTGCPNKCVRPTIHDIGITGIMKTTVNNKQCTNCGRCAEVCKKEAITYTDTAVKNNNLCIDCGKCRKACPHNAIEINHKGFEVYLGGKSGRELVEGHKINIKTEEELYTFIEQVLITYNKLADKPQRERIADTIKKTGINNFLKEVKKSTNTN